MKLNRAVRYALAYAGAGPAVGHFTTVALAIAFSGMDGPPEANVVFVGVLISALPIGYLLGSLPAAATGAIVGLLPRLSGVWLVLTSALVGGATCIILYGLLWRDTKLLFPTVIGVTAGGVCGALVLWWRSQPKPDAT